MDIRIDLSDEKPFVQSCGGEDASLYFAEYTIGIGDVFITVNPETALEIYEKLGSHLCANGRINL